MLQNEIKIKQIAMPVCGLPETVLFFAKTISYLFKATDFFWKMPVFGHEAVLLTQNAWEEVAVYGGIRLLINFRADNATVAW